MQDDFRIFSKSRRQLLAALPGAILLARCGLAAAAPEPTPTAGLVRKIDRDTGSVTIKHEAIRNLDMGPMTMVFQVRDKAMLEGLTAGDKVMFKVVDENGKLVLQELKAVK